MKIFFNTLKIEDILLKYGFSLYKVQKVIKSVYYDWSTPNLIHATLNFRHQYLA
jgi:hypothetical protein